MAGRIIIINGTSSAGKSTVIEHLREALTEPFCHYSTDMFNDSGFHAITARPCGNDERSAETKKFTRGFFRSIAAFAAENNDLIVETVLETQSQADDLSEAIAPFDNFWVAINAQEEELRRREQARGNRPNGTALHFIKTNSFINADLTVDTTNGANDAAAEIMIAWQGRKKNST